MASYSQGANHYGGPVKVEDENYAVSLSYQPAPLAAFSLNRPPQSHQTTSTHRIQPTIHYLRLTMEWIVGKIIRPSVPPFTVRPFSPRTNMYVCVEL